MATIISDGTVTVTNGSKALVFTDAKIFDKSVKAGDWIKFDGNSLPYHFELAPTNNTNATMQETYGGVTEPLIGYQIFTGFTALGLAIISSAIREGWDIVAKNFELLEDILAAAGITGLTDYRKLPLFYAGMPEQDREFGQLQLASNIEIAEIGICAEAPPEADISLDIAIAGTYQSVANLKLTAGNYSNYVTVALNGSAGNVIKMKYTYVPGGVLFPGQNYTVWLKYKGTSTLEMRYDFTVFSPGMAEAGKRIGRGFKPAVKSRYLGGMIRAQGAPLGADLKIALMHQDIQKSQTLTLIAGSTAEYTAFAQLDCLTTETFDTIITQPGTDFPGDNITVTLYSYKIT